VISERQALGVIFVYPDQPHVRRHGLAGYTTYPAYKPWLRDDFRFRCVYCLERERWYPSGQAAFGVDHTRAQSKSQFRHLLCDYENLVYACNRCNSAKRERALLNPCTSALSEHVWIDDDGTAHALTKQGRRLVNILGLNQIDVKTFRQRCLRVLRLYELGPRDPDVRALYLDHFGYPENLPDLSKLRPENNSRPAGMTDAYYLQRLEGRLAEAY
jgi:hypothetical protein